MKSFYLLAIILLCSSLQAQDEGQSLLDFEKSIEAAVVAADIPFLQKAYADDFRFKHGTGLVDSKVSWLKDVEKNKGKFISRQVDSSEVEIHENVGIIEGTITVTKTDRSYTIRYVRAYRKKNNQWELFMHRTVQEVSNK